MEKSRMSILLVEDDAADSMRIEESFADDEFMNVIRVVHDGAEALRYLRRQGEYASAPRPGLVLLDINAPKKNGFEVLEEMKADPVLQFIPVVMLTTTDRDEAIARAYKGGSCSFVPKPVDFERFKETLKSFSPHWSNVV